MYLHSVRRALEFYSILLSWLDFRFLLCYKLLDEPLEGMDHNYYEFLTSSFFLLALYQVCRRLRKDRHQAQNQNCTRIHCYGPHKNARSF